LLEVAEHYYHFDGRSPINDQNKQLIAALEDECKSSGVAMPVYWGNRNWHPFLADTLKQMQTDGIRRAAALQLRLSDRIQVAASIAKTLRGRRRQPEHRPSS